MLSMGWRVVNELMWAVELCVMFDRYCRTMGIDRNDPLVDAEWLKRHWVKACMRLGNDDIMKIISKQREGKHGAITPPDYH